MGFKKTNGFWLIKNGVMTGTATVSSVSQNIQNFDNVGLEISWTGTPTGTFTILGSISASLPDATATFYTLGTTLTNPSGSAGGYVVGLNQVPYPYLKVTYVNVSGTGVLNVFIFNKDLN